MNQAYKEALAIIVRQLVIAAGSALGVSGALTPYLGEITNYLVGAILVAVAAGWSQIAQHFKRRKLVQALGEAVLTEKQVEAMVKSPTTDTPSVMTPTHQIPKS